ncbi:hypothetical protein B9X58_12645 [Acinetobacter nosocomialis]|uniref:Uncharacterized protein n=1 Tax=Acinetobacter nosocomialis TaxID=106654 RepID=A0AB36M0L3_ACINO|nr:hypothetical protein B9X58_12645 [Acinetobacter nosocomialis]
MFITSFGEQNITYKCCSNFLIHLCFNATTSFNRSDFGLGNYVPNVGDKITVNITTEATAASAAKK